MTAADGVVLDVAGLCAEFPTRNGPVRAVRGVDLQIRTGESVAIVGESGSGKSALMLGALGLLRPAGRVTSGTSRLLGRDLLRGRQRGVLGRDVGMVFQDPLTSLHPSMTVGAQIVEAVRIHDGALDRSAARRRATELLTQVGVAQAASRLDDHPHQWSGGMRQRAMIAMAIAHRPALLVADEPTTALDVTVQAQILDLLKQIRVDRGMATVLITHDLGVVAGFADRVLVMYHGRIVEEGRVDDLYSRPQHPYTAALLSSITSVDEDTPVGAAIAGAALPATMDVPGCAFEARCDVGHGDITCRDVRPPLSERHGGEVACHHPLPSAGGRR